MAKNRLAEPEQTTPESLLPQTATATADPPSPKGRKQMTPEEKAARQAAYKLEARDAKFVRLARQRGVKAVKAIRQLAHLANRSAYEWTQEQAASIVRNLENEIASIKGKFAGSKTNGVTFNL